ncbi:hypothetical protein [uncultured Gimesia sp.]|uniref:hypothetical protein n=1 Tax=uncultured Gimesia sp. TaxID=1678688 RepID=UPI0030DA08C3|tara:strand:- start:131655 stop:132017 length:363 start_codon:yes stop_codon:yes gene_type:complete
MINAFTEAFKAGEPDRLVALLKTDATFHLDGGGKATASGKVLEGADLIARFFLKLVHPYFVDADANRLTINVSWFNGAPGLIVREAGAPATAFHFKLDAGSISGIYALRNPDKLRLFGVR